MINGNSSRGTAPSTLLELARQRAGDSQAHPAYTFRNDDEQEETFTFGELDRRARAIAATLQETAASGDRALLVYPAGLDFIAGFFGCVYAGVLAVPATYPKPRRPMPRLSAIAGDCGATIALTTSQTLATLDLSDTALGIQGLRWLSTDTVSDEVGAKWRNPPLDEEDLAILQYTSGSTSEPKGVMVSHGNVLHNLEMICWGFDIQVADGERRPGTGVFWLPAYHDMGLIGGVLMALYTGGHSVLMAPTSFLHRPLRWLKAISDHRAIISGAPNFGYELCARKTATQDLASLDLSSWRVAFCGAEPVRAKTLREFAETLRPYGFRAEAYYPCYGLAESTLLATGGHGPTRPVVKRVLRSALCENRVVEVNGGDPQKVQELVGCGRALLDQEIAIIDPSCRKRSKPGQVGEIWIKGRSVAGGYWSRSEENQQTFRASLAGGGNGAYLRTGDLGFFSDGDLYVTGRLKDVIIIRGRNYYPHDVELTAQRSHPALVPSGGAALSADLNDRACLVVIHEIFRQYRRADLRDVIQAIRRDVSDEHELDIHAVVLIRQASLPRTTSGKVQRALCRRLYLAGELKAVTQWSREGDVRNTDSDSSRQGSQPDGGNGTAAQGLQPPPAEKRANWRPREPFPFDPKNRPKNPEEMDALAVRIERWLLDWFVACAGVPADEIDRDKPFFDCVHPLAAVELALELRRLVDHRITPSMRWEYPTPAALAAYLAELVSDPGLQTSREIEPGSGGAVNQFEQLLSEIEGLSEREAEETLKRCAPEEPKSY